MPPPQPQPVYAPPMPHEPTGMPSWLMAVLAFVVIGAVLGGLYYLRSASGSSSAGKSAAKTAEAAPEASGHPYAKYLEITGIRLLEEGAKVKVRFTAVNHSTADLAGVAIAGSLTSANGKPDDPPVASFEARIGNLGGMESKDFTVPAKTTLRAYELPDWQFLKAKFEFTSPK